jgi:N-acetyl-gamma-glutamyl-phosphate reductase
LKIYERFSEREDITLVHIDPELRKDVGSRLDCMSEADITFLCLPDEASREIVAAAEKSGMRLRIIDTSTAFRTAPDWIYGLPELESGMKEAIASADRVAGPGCHAAGFILIAHPLISSGIVPEDYPFTCHSVTGYSGGGKKMIAEYESPRRGLGGGLGDGGESGCGGLGDGGESGCGGLGDSGESGCGGLGDGGESGCGGLGDGGEFGCGACRAPRQYGLTQAHKHLPEMQLFSGAKSPILFSPTVADYYSGMLVTAPLHSGAVRNGAGPDELYEIFTNYYADCPMIKTVPPGMESDNGFLDADAFSGRDDLELLFYGSRERPVIAARFDNLGKGASGNAVQCMNLMLGLPETAGLL